MLILYTYFQLGNQIQAKEKVGEVIQAKPEDIVKQVKNEIGEKTKKSTPEKIAERGVIIEVGEVKIENLLKVINDVQQENMKIVKKEGNIKRGNNIL